MTQRLRKPDWLRIRLGGSERFMKTKDIVKFRCLHTVRISGKCPSMSKCWSRGTTTSMIGGKICTRFCRFCNTLTGKSPPSGPEEPANVAESIRLMDLKHAVITSVDRDDLSDSGVSRWVSTTRTIREVDPQMIVEVLIPDFRGRLDLADQVVDMIPEIISHNMEAVRRINPQVRSAAEYDVSLFVLRRIAERGVVAKIGIVVRLGEAKGKVFELMDDVLQVGVFVLTIGQYLQPSRKSIPVSGYVTPERFEYYRQQAVNKGFKKVENAPLVYSPYHAERHI